MSKLRVILCGQRSFGAAVFDDLRLRPDLEICAVYAPPGDRLHGRAEVYGFPVRTAGTLRSETMPAAPSSGCPTRSTAGRSPPRTGALCGRTMMHICSGDGSFSRWALL